MDREAVSLLRIGIYRIFWKSGGSSVAAVGCTRSGDKWIAPLNWVRPSEDMDIWDEVESVVLLIEK